MEIEKKVINYYASFYDVSKELNQKQFYEFNMAIFSVMFFEEDIDNISFDDKMLSLLWKSVKHSIDSSIKGFCSKKDIPYEDIFKGVSKGVDKVVTNNANEKEKEKEKGKENEKDKRRKSFFALDKLTSFDNLSDEYIEALKKKIEESNETLYIRRVNAGSPLKDLLTFDEFSTKFLASGKKQKDFWMTFKQYEKYTFENEVKRNAR